MLNSLITLVSFLVAIGIIAIVHELGHYSMARFFKMGVSEFAIGFGKKICGFVRKGTEWNLRLIPIAGYVEIKGMSPDEEGVDPKEAFHNRSGFQKSLVLVAGATMNLILAFFIWWGVFYMKGAPAPMPPVIGRIIDGGAAQIAGLKSGDRVLSIQGQTLESLYDLVKTVAISPDKPLEFKVVSTHLKDYKASDIRSLIVTPTKSKDKKFNGAGTIGIEHSVQPPVVGSVVSGYPADKAGLKSGDKIIEINTKTVNSWSEMSEMFSKNADIELNIAVLRDGKRVELKITPKGVNMSGGPGLFKKLKSLFSGSDKKKSLTADASKTIVIDKETIATDKAAIATDEATTKTAKAVALTKVDDSTKKIVKRGIVGIKGEIATSKRIKVSLGTAFVKAGLKLKNTCWQVLDGIYLMFSGKIPGGISNASGPVGIARMTGEFARSFYMFLEWIALLSTYIGIFNLIPFPALDGGRIFFLAIEGIIGKPVKYEEQIHTIGLLLLLSMLVIVTYFDISKWIFGL